MRVMRMALGRGQSHFNLTDFLLPFFKRLDLVKYPLKTVKPHQDIIRDKLSYLPACSYMERLHTMEETGVQPCKLFSPVVTDLGKAIHIRLVDKTHQDGKGAFNNHVDKKGWVGGPELATFVHV